MTPGRLSDALGCPWDEGVVGIVTTMSEPWVLCASLARFWAWASALIDGAYDEVALWKAVSVESSAWIPAAWNGMALASPLPIHHTRGGSCPAAA